MTVGRGLRRLTGERRRWENYHRQGRDLVFLSRLYDNGGTALHEVPYLYPRQPFPRWNTLTPIRQQPLLRKVSGNKVSTSALLRGEALSNWENMSWEVHNIPTSGYDEFIQMKANFNRMKWPTHTDWEAWPKSSHKNTAKPLNRWLWNESTGLKYRLYLCSPLVQNENVSVSNIRERSYFLRNNISLISWLSQKSLLTRIWNYGKMKMIGLVNT